MSCKFLATINTFYESSQLIECSPLLPKNDKVHIFCKTFWHFLQNEARSHQTVQIFKQNHLLGKILHLGFYALIFWKPWYCRLVLTWMQDYKISKTFRESSELALAYGWWHDISYILQKKSEEWITFWEEQVWKVTCMEGPPYTSLIDQAMIACQSQILGFSTAWIYTNKCKQK